MRDLITLVETDQDSFNQQALNSFHVRLREKRWKSDVDPILWKS